MMDRVGVTEAEILRDAWHFAVVMFEFVAHVNAGLLFEECLDCLPIVGLIGFMIVVDGGLFVIVGDGEFVDICSRNCTFSWSGCSVGWTIQWVALVHNHFLCVSAKPIVGILVVNRFDNAVLVILKVWKEVN